MDNEGGRTQGFEPMLAVWSRRKWLAIFVFIGPFVAVSSIVMFLPGIYESTATVLVESQQVPEAFVRSTITSEVQTRLQTITQDILSRSRLEGLITRFGLYINMRKRAPLEDVIERMRSDVRLDLKEVQEKGGQGRTKSALTVAFTVSYRGTDPQTVAQVTNALASFYIEENLKARERQATGTAEFLKVQLEEAKKKLDELEGRVSAFKQRYMGELPQQQTANLATLERLNTQLRLNNDNLPRALERREAMEKQLAELESATGGPGATAERVTKLRQELTELKTRFTDVHPTVVRKQLEIDDLERQLAEDKGKEAPKKEKVVSASQAALKLKQSFADVNAEIAALKAEATNLRRDIAAYQQRLENTPRREQEFQLFARDYDTTKKLYASLLERYEESKLAESMEQRQKGEQFRVLDPATPSEDPVAPNSLRLILIGLMLSLGLAVGAVVLAEQLDASFHTVDDLRAFSRVPVLVSIPPLVTEADAAQRRWRMRLAAVTATLVLILTVGGSYLVARGNEQLTLLLEHPGRAGGASTGAKTGGK